eukprot:m.27648 g.27648  ORF g.27648 m.27648 type:complete len:832 (-) comp11768_c0_seq1:7-2502(-)
MATPTTIVISDATAAAEALRKQCKRAFFKSRDLEGAQAVVTAAREQGYPSKDYVNIGNENGKTALMYASQLSNSAELVEYLLNLGADPNATTNRGHSPVMFAAGKGRVAALKLLLAAGGTAKIRVVTGDTPVSLSKDKLPSDAHQLLIEDEANNPLEWQDFTSNPIALRAQQAHTLTCRHCREKAGLGPRVKTKADPVTLPHRSVPELQELVLTLLNAMPTQQKAEHHEKAESDGDSEDEEEDEEDGEATAAGEVATRQGDDNKTTSTHSQPACIKQVSQWVCETIATVFEGDGAVRRQCFHDLPLCFRAIEVQAPDPGVALHILLAACSRRLVLTILDKAGVYYKKAVNMLKMIQKCIKTLVSDTQTLCQHIPDIVDWALDNLVTMADPTLATLLLENMLLAVRAEQCQATTRSSTLYATVLEDTPRLLRRMISLSNPGEVVRFVNTLSDIFRDNVIETSPALQERLDSVVASSLRLIVASGHYPVAESMVDKWDMHACDTNKALPLQCQYRQLVVDEMLTPAVHVVTQLHEAFSPVKEASSNGDIDPAARFTDWLEQLTKVSASSILKLVDRWSLTLSPLCAEAIETMLCGKLLQHGDLTEAAEYAQGRYYLECLVELTGSSVEVLLQADAIREVTLAEDALRLPEDVVVTMVSTVQDLQDTRASMQGLVASGLCMIGIDTEWRSPRPCCAIVQIAVCNSVWILDCLPALNDPVYASELDSLLTWIFKLPSPHTRIGFAFEEDVRHLHLLAPSSSLNHLKQVHDVQASAGRALGLKRPGLTTVCRQLLDKPLNKSNQTSNWERRPLRQDQLDYASVDAWCLLKLYACLQ